jgi:phosphatidylglycerophosphate synthase
MVSTVRTGPVIGLIGQFLLFAVLARTVGLGVAGWLAGLAYGVITCALLTRGLHRSGSTALGPADRVTLARATLVGGVVALTADSFTRQPPVAVLLTLAVVALALDAVDGKVARHTGTASALGARFDMEVDAFLALTLSAYAARPVGAWVLAVGGMRYAYVAAAWALPWLRRPLPPRYWRKVVAATQGAVLISAAATHLLPPALLTAALAATLALLIESFGRDIAWQWDHRYRRPAASTLETASRRSTAPDRQLPVEQPQAQLATIR